MDFTNCRIYYSGNQYPTYYIDVPITRWDEGNWDLTIEIFLDSGNRNTLFTHLVPGAVGELYNILGTPYYKDITYTSSNTLIIHPLTGYGLSSLREGRMIAVKNISDTFINPEYFGIKIEGFRTDI